LGKLRNYSIAIVVLCFYVVPNAIACSCASITSPCVHLNSADAVFVGKVSAIDEEAMEIPRFGKTEKIRTSLTAHLEIQNAYKGLPPDRKAIDVLTGGGGGDCGFDFKTGERYLIFAYKTSSGLFYQTGICDGTRPISEARDYIELIEALQANRTETRIFGEVSLYERELGTGPMDVKYHGPLAGIRVEARGNGSVFYDKTDGEGRYRFRNIPPGKYQVRPHMSSAYSGYLGLDGMEEAEVGLPENCGAEVDLIAQLNGVIRGRVLDWKGRPVGRNVEVSLITAESKLKGIGRLEGSSAYTEPDGSYKFDGLPGGKYIVGVGLLKAPDWRSPFSKVFYPAAADAAATTVLNLGMGTKRNGIDIHLPPPATLTVIRGYVFDKSGAPVEGALIEVFDVEYGKEIDIPEVGYNTTFDGNFSVTAIQGRRYEVRAYLVEHYLEGTGSQSESVPLTTNENLKPVTLVLSKPGIFRPQK
jgi:hypothetical protein